MEEMSPLAKETLVSDPPIAFPWERWPKLLCGAQRNAERLKGFLIFSDYTQHDNNLHPHSMLTGASIPQCIV